MARIRVYKTREEAIQELKERGRSMHPVEREALISFIAQRIDAHQLADMLLPVLEQKDDPGCQQLTETSEPPAPDGEADSPDDN